MNSVPQGTSFKNFFILRKIYEIHRQQSDIYSGKILEIFVYFGLFQEKGSTKCSKIFKEDIWVQFRTHIS